MFTAVFRDDDRAVLGAGSITLHKGTGCSKGVSPLPPMDRRRRSFGVVLHEALSLLVGVFLAAAVEEVATVPD